MTTQTYKSFQNRLDRRLTGFSAADNAALLSAICSNATTAYVKQMKPGGPVSVPSHAAEAVKAHLAKLGWTAE